MKSGKFFFINYFTLFSQAHLFAFKNRYEINGDKVFLSFVLKNLILIIKHNRKVKFSIELFTFHLSTSAKLKTCFSRKERLKNALALKSKKVQVIFRNALQLIFADKTVFQIFFVLLER